jgi:hypothetical protein
MAGIPMEKLKPVLILSGILTLLLILFLFTGDKDTKEERRVDSLVGFDADEISTLRIETEKRPALQFSRTEDGWVMEEPLFSRASGESMKSLIETLDKLVGVPIEIDTRLPLSDFGLEGGERILVRVRSRDGREESFSLGKQIPLDVGYVYTHVPSGGKFYKVHKDARELFTLPLEEYREKTLLNIAISSIEEIRIMGHLAGARSPVIIEKQPPWWELTAPEAAPGNNAKVKELLEGVLSLRASDFPEEYEAALQEDPELSIEFSNSGGSTASVAFFASYGDNLQYVSTDRVSYALGIPRGVLDNLPLSFDQLRSRSALRLDPDTVQEIVVKTDGDDIILRKNEDGWRLAGDRDLPADDAAVRQIINHLIFTEVEDLPESFDIRKDETPIQMQLKLTEDNGNTHWVELGTVTDGTSLPGFSSFREQPFSVPADFLEGLRLNAEFFEDKHLLSFESRNVGSLRIQGKNTNIILEKSGSDWILTEPERGAADSPKSWGLVFALEKLVYEQKISAAVFNERGFSPDKPDYRIRIFDSSRKEQGSLDLWIDEAQVYASSPSREGLFMVDSELLDRIPKDHTELIFRR